MISRHCLDIATREPYPCKIPVETSRVAFCRGVKKRRIYKVGATPWDSSLCRFNKTWSCVTLTTGAYSLNLPSISLLPVNCWQVISTCSLYNCFLVQVAKDLKRELDL